MKKSFVLMTVIVATLAFTGLVLAGSCGLPPVCGEQLYVSKSAPWTGKWMAPKGAPIKPPKMVTPKCGPCYTVPGSPYAIGPRLENRSFKKTVDVMRDLCVGKAKGKTKLCGPCAPTIAWSGSWKTSEIVGKTDVTVVVPPAYNWEEAPRGPIGVKAIPKPLPPAECF
jgi:hypothetical protein